jgi:streptogramin lyase
MGVVTSPDGTQYVDLLAAGYMRFVRSLEFNRFHRVLPDEEYNLPKVSFNAYGTVDLWWVVGAFNGIVNPAAELAAGTLLKMPTVVSVDAYIRSMAASRQGRGVVVLR